jgi:outer membrane protein
MRAKWKSLAQTAVLSGMGLLLTTGTTMAQVDPKTSEVHVYAGYLFGDDLTDGPVSGQTPQLDDDLVLGLRYAYNFTSAWGFEASLGYNPNSVTELAGPDVDMDLWLVDLNAVWRFRQSKKLTPYLTFGLGYAKADLDRPLTGTVDGQNVTIEDDGGTTANVGVGLAYSLTDTVVLRGDLRYRYIGSLVDTHDDSLNSPEATFGVGWRF